MREQQIAWTEWQELHSVEYWGVRGPRSQRDIDSALTRSARVVGDPALFLGDIIEPSLADRTGIAIAIGAGGEGYKVDRDALTTTLASVVNKRFRTARVTLVALADQDQQHVDQLRRKLLVSGSIGVEYYRNVEQVYRELARHRVVISERLHGAIAAAAVDVPPITIGYLSKHADFMESVGLGDLALRRDELTEQRLNDALDQALTGGTQRTLMRQRQVLRGEMAEVRRRFSAMFESGSSQHVSGLE